MKSPIVPISIFVLTALVWLATAIASHRFFYAFRRKYPEIAAQQIPYAFESISHPRKATFAFSVEVRELVRNDRELSRLRRQYVLLALVAVIVPLLGFGSLFVTAAILGPME